MLIQKKFTGMLEEFRKLKQFTIFILILVILTLLVALIFISQYLAERSAFTFNLPNEVSDPKLKYEIAKLVAEVKQIRSDTSGSLFWIKFIGFLITVIGAVGGYLFGQSDVTRRKIEAEDERNAKRIKFEHRKDVDNSYQAIVQELSNDKPILRSAAAVKLGSILQSFPAEWDVSEERKKQLIQLTKQVLAAALSIEKDEKVLKTISIALVLDKTMPAEVKGKKVNFANVRELDLSGAEAKDAYWAKADFSYADFFCANLSKTSFRSAILEGTQFREANLMNTVFIDANCQRANFTGAKVYGMNLNGAILTEVNTDVEVNVSADEGSSKMVKFSEWIKENSFKILPAIDIVKIQR